MKIDQKILIEIVKENDPDVEKEFRKGSSFYATAEVVIEDETYFDFVESLVSDGEKSFLVGKKIVATGYWSDDWGLDLYDAEVYESHVEHVPEEVIVRPAHDVIVWKSVEG